MKDIILKNSTDQVENDSKQVSTSKALKIDYKSATKQEIVDFGNLARDVYLNAKICDEIKRAIEVETNHLGAAIAVDIREVPESESGKNRLYIDLKNKKNEIISSASVDLNIGKAIVNAELIHIEDESQYKWLLRFTRDDGTKFDCDITSLSLDYITRDAAVLEASVAYTDQITLAVDPDDDECLILTAPTLPTSI